MVEVFKIDENLKDMADNLRERKATWPISLISFENFMALEIPPREMLLSPILPEKAVAMVYAPRGAGKTFLGLSIGLAVASGGALFRWSAPKPRRVLYVDGEMPAAVLQERLGYLVRGLTSVPPSEHFNLVCADLHEDGLPDLGNRFAHASYEALLDGVSLVVLDNLSALVRSGRENEADSWQPMQDFLLRLRRRGVSVLLIHHAGKGGQQRGTSRREDLLDTIVSLRRPGDYQPCQGARFEVHIEKARGLAGPDLNPFEAMLEVRDNVAFWTTRTTSEATLDRVVAMTLDGLTIREISDETGIPKSTVSRLQQEAVSDGLLDAAPKRGGKGGRRFTWGDDD